MNGLGAEELLRLYRESLDREIDYLLSSYGSSLAEVKEMYPLLISAVEKRRQAAFPTQPIFFEPTDLSRIGLHIDEGWRLKITPTDTGYLTSFITPTNWEIREDDLFISPKGEQFTRADLQALLSYPTGEATLPQLPPYEYEDLTETGQEMYDQYQSSGGTLSVDEWIRLREEQQINLEEVFGRVFPEREVNEVIQYMQTNPEGFLQDLREIGATEDVVALLKTLRFPDETGGTRQLTDEEINLLLRSEQEYIPESIWKDAWDALMAGGMRLIQGLQTVFTLLPSISSKLPSPLKPPSVALENLLVKAITNEEQRQAFYQEIDRQTMESYLRQKQLHQQFWLEHPELIPRPEYLESPFKNPSLLRDPGFWLYNIADSLAYTVAVGGTMVVVSSVATPAVGIPAGLIVGTSLAAGPFLDELLGMGVPLEEATQKATLCSLVEGGVETISDLPFLGLVFKPLRPAVEPLRKAITKATTNAIGKFVITGLTISQIEGLEEAVTQLAQNAILKEYENISSIFEGVDEAYIRGAIASSPFALIGGGASIRTFRNNLSQQTRERFDQLVNDFQKAGLTEEQAQVQAANEIAKTPEGMDELSKAVDAARDEYFEENKLPRLEEQMQRAAEMKKEISQQILDDMKVKQSISKEVAPPIPPATKVIDKHTWQAMPVPERVNLVKSLGLEGKVGSKDWANLTPEEREIISGAKTVPQEAKTTPATHKAVPETVKPEPTDKLIQARIREYLRLRGYDAKVAESRIAEIKESLEKKGRLPKDVGTKETLRLQLARLYALQQLAAVKNLIGIDSLIGQVKTEIDNRAIPFHSKTKNLFPEYTLRQLEEMLDIYRQARSMLGAVAPEAVTMPEAAIAKPEPTNNLVQARVREYLRLKGYNAEAVEKRITEIKSQLAKKGRLPKDIGTKGNLRLELARLEALRDLESVETLAGLDALIREVGTELGNRDLPYHGRARNLFPGYTIKQLEEMLDIYRQARDMLKPEIPAEPSVKAEDIPLDVLPMVSDKLTPAQVQKTIRLFKEALMSPDEEARRAAALELRKHVFAQRVKNAKESAEAWIIEGMNPEEAVKAAEKLCMSGKLPDVTTDYFDDLTHEMRTVLFAKVYNYWKDKPEGFTELIATYDALTNALAGKSIPRKPGTGTRYFPEGGSAWDRLVRVFADDTELIAAFGEGKSLREIVEGIYLEAGREAVPLTQETIDWLKSLTDLTEEDKLLLTKPLSELTEEEVQRIAQRWFYRRKAELATLLRDGVITENQYQLQLAVAKDRVFPYRRIAAPPSYPNDTFEQLPLLTFKEKASIVRTLKSIGMTIVDIGNFIRANKASCDMSAPRQLATVAFANPVEMYRGFIEGWKCLKSEAAYEANKKWVQQQPSYPYFVEMVRQTGEDFLRLEVAPKGTEQWRAAEEFGMLTEERPIPRLAARLPWIKAPARAFAAWINTTTILIYNKCLKAAQAEAEAVSTGLVKLKEGESFSVQKEMNDYGRALAWMTQRAALPGPLRKISPIINAILFAPRSLLGRILSPALLVHPNPRVRAFAWKNLMTFITLRAAFVMLGFYLGLWDVERDPRSGEFMSIRIGHTRIDPWAGNRRILTFLTRFITHSGISSLTGAEFEVNPTHELFRFFRSSASPLTGGLIDLLEGRTYYGEKLDPKSFEQWIERLAPFAVQDILEAFLDDWQHGALVTLPAIFGEGVMTYTGDWEENWQKLGLPKYPDNLPYGIDEPVYDLADFWADTASQFKGVDPETLTERKGYPEYIRLIAETLQILDQISLLPSTPLVKINADPEKGTTFIQYYQMWLDRQKIVESGDKKKLEEFDKDERTRKAYLGNMTQAQYALLLEYHALPDSEKAGFLAKHPELTINPRQEWLRNHPRENALLVLWDKAKFYSLEAMDILNSLVQSLGIPENALLIDELDEITKLRIKNQHLSNLKDALMGLDDEIKGPDGLTERDRALKEFYEQYPEFRDGERRIEALSVGTEKEPTPPEMVEAWVERGRLVDEYGANSPEVKLWLIDNKEAHKWALDHGLLTDTSEDWNENILRLKVQYRDQFELYDSYGDRNSPNYIAGDKLRKEARDALLFTPDMELTAFGIAYYTLEALEKEIPEQFIPNYVEFYGIRKKPNVDYSAGWYEDDWYLIEHPEFYEMMFELEIWKERRDFSKVPTREVYAQYRYYLSLPKGKPREEYRATHPDLDAWLVLAKGYKPIGDRGQTTTSSGPWEEYTDVYQFMESFE